MSKSRVAVVKGDERYAIIKEALRLIKEDVDPASIRGRRVLIKPNLVSVLWSLPSPMLMP
jgi:hypothetical protein